MTYRLRFRQHIFKVQVEEGLTDSETARRFHIGLSSLKWWAKIPSLLGNVIEKRELI